MIGLVLQALGAAALLSLPFLAVGVRATLDLRRDGGRRYRTSPARPRTRAVERSGPAGASSLPARPGRPVSGERVVPPTGALAGLQHRRRVRG